MSGRTARGGTPRAARIHVLKLGLMGHRSMSALLAAGLLGVTGLAACAGPFGGTDEEPATPSTPTSIDGALLECGELSEDSAQLAEIEVDVATWQMPDGFVETFAYSEDRAVEHVERIWVAEPEQDPEPLNVLTVVGYGALDWGEGADECGRVPLAAIDERLAGYHVANGAEALTEASPTEIAGLPAVEQDVQLPEYSYRGYWVFGRQQLLHLYCQWTDESQKEIILAACEELVDSVEVPGD